MKTIAVTGNIAGGKTTVLNIIKSLGIPVICCDTVYHNLLKTKKSISKKLANELTDTILSKEGFVDTKKLRDWLKNNPAKLLTVEKIVHPEILGYVYKQLNKYKTKGVKIVAVDIPLLYEKHLEKKFDFVLTVYCTRKIQAQRLLSRGINLQEIKFLLSRQFPIKYKIARSDYVINNSNLTISDLKKKVEKIIKKIESDC